MFVAPLIVAPLVLFVFVVAIVIGAIFLSSKRISGTWKEIAQFIKLALAVTLGILIFVLIVRVLVFVIDVQFPEGF